MRWLGSLATLFLIVGIVLSPLRAVAATVPVLFAYDVAVQPTARAALGRSDAVRPERGGRPEYAYDAVHVGYDRAANARVVARTGAVRAYGPALNFRNRREVGEGAIYDAPAATPAAEATGTVWDAVKATQPVWEGTSIPRSFELATENGSVWVHGNATEHLAEYATSMLGRGVTPDVVNVAMQAQIGSLQGAVNSALQGRVTYGQMMNVGGWELMFGAPRAAGQLPALIHAMPF